jgi:hypothetical protein
MKVLYQEEVEVDLHLIKKTKNNYKSKNHCYYNIN